MDWYYWGVALFMVGLIGNSLKMRNMDKPQATFGKPHKKKEKTCPYKKYDDL
jgi:hypothetical protein